MPSDLNSQGAGDSSSGVYSIFMESVAPVRAAEVQPVDAADFRPALLSANGIKRVVRMLIDKQPKHFVQVNQRIRIQRHANIFWNGKRLQSVHVISHGHRAAAVAAVEMKQIVPGCTRIG